MTTNHKANKRVIDSIKDRVIKNEFARLKTSNFYIQETVFNRGQRLPIPRQEYKINKPSIMVFSDDAPIFNWSHPCRYLLYDAETGEMYKEIEANFPPYNKENESPKSFYAFQEAVIHYQTRVYPTATLEYKRYYSFFGNRYAILFSGMSDNRHTNDLEFLYRTLRNVYAVPKSNITVLNYDGTLNYSGDPRPVSRWPGDNTSYTMPVHGSGSKSNLLSALNDLKTKLNSNDSLFIHTNNHGGHNGTESDLCCYPNWDSLGVKDFTDKLAELPKFRCLMVMMEQCHSGGFNSSVISKSTAVNTSIASACVELNSSIGGADFDPFARNWISAMTGNDPYGHPLSSNPDTSGEGRITAKEAFDYANAIHDPYDTPVFNYSNSGRSCWLGKNLLIQFIPPLLVHRFIRKHWPEPDPLIFEKRLKLILPQLAELNEKVQLNLTEIREQYEKQINEIFIKAKKIK